MPADGEKVNTVIEVLLTEHTCSCGVVYALPHWVVSCYQCPMCASRQVRKLLLVQESLVEATTRLEHVVRGLRGALKQRRASR